MKQTQITICIPTCYGGESLVKAVESIRNSNYEGKFRILVAADSVPISAPHKRLLKQENAELTENKIPGPQMHKVKQMLANASSEIFIFTQDDVRFDDSALNEIVNTFKKNPNLTMVGANIVPEPATTWFEKVLEVGLRGAANLGKSWRRGDNYLLANGRCMAFRTRHLQKMRIPDAVVNADAYLYFENKRKDGQFAFADKAVVYNKSPLTLKEHLRQARRFRYSKEELLGYFGNSIRSEYQIPAILRLKSVFNEFLADPINTAAYLVILAYTVMTLKTDPDARTAMWKVNFSTKRA